MELAFFAIYISKYTSLLYTSKYTNSITKRKKWKSIIFPEISPRGGSRCAEGVGRISKNIMFAVFRQRPAKMANSPLSEFNVLYNAAMWLPVGGYFGRWARYTPPPACPGTFSRRRWVFSAFGTSMRPPLSLTPYALLNWDAKSFIAELNIAK